MRWIFGCRPVSPESSRVGGFHYFGEGPEDMKVWRVASHLAGIGRPIAWRRGKRSRRAGMATGVMAERARTEDTEVTEAPEFGHFEKEDGPTTLKRHDVEPMVAQAFRQTAR
jgi:hypothetical protein